MRQLRLAQDHRVRRYAAIVVVACTVLVAGLGAGTAQAAPRDNVANARLCLNGGWKTLTTSNGRHFRNVGQCVIYALFGGQFGSTTPPATPPPTTPPPGE